MCYVNAMMLLVILVCSSSISVTSMQIIIPIDVQLLQTFGLHYTNFPSHQYTTDYPLLAGTGSDILKALGKVIKKGKTTN